FVINESATNSEVIIESSSDEENFNKLIKGQVDILIADRLVGAQLLWEQKLGHAITEHPLLLPAKPIHALFHKSTDPVKNKRSLELIEQFNKGVEQLSGNDTIKDIIGEYLFPVLLNITVQTKWFYAVDIIGAVFFALAGLLLARDQKYDIFGTLVVVALLTTGGGLMRDIIVGRSPTVINSSEYGYIVLVVSSFGFLICLLHDYLLKKFNKYQELTIKNKNKFDFLRSSIEAMALGAYTIIGVGVACEMKVAPLWFWGPLLGCLTSCGGGILARALQDKSNSKTMRGDTSPKFSFLGGAMFSYFLMWQVGRLNPKEVKLAVIDTIAITTVFILWTQYKGISSPCLNPRNTDS
ncbi:MAG: TRIC cation channel family protein, partial [Lentisphaeraceae bacterium]|nr:TRIC cation channel family protein [Lentisphaeraceae bacterium]